MSTKIYNGLISTDRNAMRTIHAIREVLEPMFYAKYVAAVEEAEAHVGEPFAKLFGLSSISMGDAQRWMEPIEAGFGNPKRVWDAIIELQQTTTHTFSKLDFGYEVSIIPNGRGFTTEPLVLVYSERGGNEYRQELIDLGVVREYGYWNNTDQPEEVSNREWGQRKKAWTSYRAPNGSEWWAPSEVDARIGQPSEVNTVYRLVAERAEARGATDD